MQNKSFGEESPFKPTKNIANFKPSEFEAVSLKFSSVICIDNLLRKQHNPYKKITFSSFQQKQKYSFNESRTSGNPLKKQLQPHHRKIRCHSFIDNILKQKSQKSMPLIKQNKVMVFRANQSVEKKQQYFDFYLNDKGSEQNFKLQSRKVHPIPKLNRTQKIERGHKMKSVFEDRYMKGDARSASQSKNHEKIIAPSEFLSENTTFTKQFKPKLGKQRFKHSKNPFHIPKKYPNEQKTNTIAKKLRLLTQKNQHFFNFLHRNNSAQNLFGKCQNQIQQQKIDLISTTELKFDSIQQQQQDINSNFFSRSVCVTQVDYSNQQLNIIFRKNQEEKCQIASITKVMTCLLAINIADKFKINLQQEKIFTSEKAAKMPGTSANLQYSDQGTVMELLYGMMLPSGNDAAVAIAQWGGKTIRKYCGLIKRYRHIKSSVQKSHKIAPIQPTKKSFIKLFLIHMNKLCKILGLQNTFFANSHGLMNEKSYSTAKDVVKLASIAMQNSKFRKIVAAKSFQCKLFNRTLSQYRTVFWQNTNKLLGVDGFVGVKTGITPSAGPCLVSQYQFQDKYCFVICILKTKNMEMRFKQSLVALKQAISLRLKNNITSSKKKLEYLKILERLGQKNIDYTKFIPRKQQPMEDINNMKTINSSEDELDKQQVLKQNF